MIKIKTEPGTNPQDTTNFEMRAPPRRRKDITEQPIFLKKAYTLINACPNDIGGWSSRGDTFIIKDSQRFAQEIIPKYYKHNNFSSFVRQLNFYGFRKVRSDNLLNPTWWEFRHPNFLRDFPEQLADIKRSIHFENSNQGTDVNEIRNQVGNLRDRMDIMDESMTEIQDMMMRMMKDQNQNKNFKLTSNKKRKSERDIARSNEDMDETDVNDIDTDNTSNENMQPDDLDDFSGGAQSSLMTGSQLATMDLFKNDMDPLPFTRTLSLGSIGSDEGWNNLLFGRVEDLASPVATGRMEVNKAPSVAAAAVAVNSNASVEAMNMGNSEVNTKIDAEINAEMVIESLAPIDTAAPLTAESAATTMGSMDSPMQNMDNIDISRFMTSLPLSLQERFVDKLAESMSAKLMSMLANESAIATPCKTPGNNEAMNASHSGVKFETPMANPVQPTAGMPAIAYPLASAVLGIVMARLHDNSNMAQFPQPKLGTEIMQSSA